MSAETPEQRRYCAAHPNGSEVPCVACLDARLQYEEQNSRRAIAARNAAGLRRYGVLWSGAAGSDAGTSDAPGSWALGEVDQGNDRCKMSATAPGSMSGDVSAAEIRRESALLVTESGALVADIERRFKEAVETAGLDSGVDGRVVSERRTQSGEGVIHTTEKEQLGVQETPGLRVALDELGVRLGLRFRVLLDRGARGADEGDELRGVVLIQDVSSTRAGSDAGTSDAPATTVAEQDGVGEATPQASPTHDPVTDGAAS